MADIQEEPARGKNMAPSINHWGFYRLIMQQIGDGEQQTKQCGAAKSKVEAIFKKRLM